MMQEDIKQQKAITQEFVKAKPQELPAPTYMPFIMALSMLFIGWGLLSIWIITVAGLIGLGISVYGWIKELLHERTEKS